MFVVLLSERFDNQIKNKPLFASLEKNDSVSFISERVAEDCKNEWAIREFFNGKWSRAEIESSFRNDYTIVEIPHKI